MESSDVRAVGGTPFSMVVDRARTDPHAMDAYFDEALESIRWMRETDCGGGAGIGGSGSSGSKGSGGGAPHGHPQLSLSPLDKMRLELDELWPGGATLLKDKATGRPFLPGVGRVMHGPTIWPEGFAHVDDLAALEQVSGIGGSSPHHQLVRSVDS